MRRRALLGLLLALLLCTPALALDETDLGAAQVEEAVPPEARSVLGGTEAGRDPEGALGRVWDYARDHLRDLLAEVLRPLTAMVAVCVLCGVGESFAAASGRGDMVALGGCLAIAVLGVEDVHSVLALGRDTLVQLLDFSRVLLPTLTTAAAASGAVSSATAAYAASALFSDLLLSLAQSLILPMICAFTAATVASAVLGDKRLDGAVRFLQWAAKLLMKGLVLAFTAYLSLTGILAASTDAATVKAAKTVLSTALPVVGKLMADASEALVAGAGLLRGAIGIYGLLACLVTVLLPVLRLGLRCLLFRGVAALCAGLAGQRQLRLISGLGNAYGMLLGLVGSAAAMEFLAVISLIRTVTL